MNLETLSLNLAINDLADPDGNPIPLDQHH